VRPFAYRCCVVSSVDPSYCRQSKVQPAQTLKLLQRAQHTVCTPMKRKGFPKTTMTSQLPTRPAGQGSGVSTHPTRHLLGVWCSTGMVKGEVPGGAPGSVSGKSTHYRGTAHTWRGYEGAAQAMKRMPQVRGGQGEPLPTPPRPEAAATTLCTPTPHAYNHQQGPDPRAPAAGWVHPALQPSLLPTAPLPCAACVAVL